MEFIVASVVAIGAFFFGASIGRDTGRKEVIADIRRRMAQCIQNESGMLKEWGIKADTVVVDYFADSQHGNGHAEGSRIPYLVVNHDDLIQKLKTYKR